MGANLHVCTPPLSWLMTMLPSRGKKIQTILKAAGVDVEPYWPGLFAKALESCNVKDLITNVGSGVGAAPAAGGAAPAAGEQHPLKKRRKKRLKSQRRNPMMTWDLACLIKI